MAFAKAPRLGKDDTLGNRAWTRSFKVYSDTQKTDPACKVGAAHKTRIPLRRKSVTISSGATSNTNNMKKGTSRVTGQNKSINENSEKYTKVTRKALADLSNVGGNTLRPALSGSSTMKWKGVKCSNPQSYISKFEGAASPTVSLSLSLSLNKRKIWRLKDNGVREGKDDILGNRAWTRSFKVYTDTQKTDPACKVGAAHKTRIPLRRKSVTISSGATSNTNNMKKGTSRVTGQNKSINENSEKYTKVTRKALADLSNVGGNTLRPALSGSSTM
ncbi:hypothetical protein F2Q69_00026847 [Brassica cretica]|uniref:Uncharacterized protein n=1 Tax=Brassica cretica TaxID=69181 RepID=A0A8S9S1P7_BRACR|nr:hypothetical protein F2Q69_00026847 [Brassica cretica]